MARRHTKDFKTKHPKGTKVADHILNALRPRFRDGRITCADAHALARKLNVSPKNVGIGVDLCEACITACQLGLFGNAPSADTGPSADPLPLELTQAIQTASIGKTITCLQAWQIGQSFGAKRRQVGKICNSMEVKVIQCQLGAF